MCITHLRDGRCIQILAGKIEESLILKYIFLNNQALCGVGRGGGVEIKLQAF
jgi:hypothetical protein